MLNSILNLLDNVSCFILKNGDEFLSEYPQDNLNRLSRLLGFTGSNGMAIFYLNQDKMQKIFLTDSRYTLQAKDELKDFEIYDIQNKSLTQLLQEACIKNIIINTKICSLAFCQKLKDLDFHILHNTIDEELLKIDYSKISGEAIIFDKDELVFGVAKEQKLKLLAKYINDKKCDAIFLSDPIDVNYILNIRGKDFGSVPIKACFAIIKSDGDYMLFENNDLYNFSSFIKISDRLIVSNVASQYCFDLLDKLCNVILVADRFVEFMRAVKNKTEIENLTKICLQDSKVLNKFITTWIIDNKNIDQESEISLSEQLFKMRSSQSNFVCNSFDTISAFGANGAIVHYKPSKASDTKITGDGLYLLDSGGHYFYGTTDVTRTVLVGKAKKEWVTNFTLVLKGHIAIASLVFPDGLSGSDIDILARQHLWSQGLDYGHGTGHGVGYLLSVHEGPCGISRYNRTAFKEGMVVSNEPGFYKQREYGIRIENLLLVQKSQKYQNFLEFKTLTFVALDERLVDKSMLTIQELDWFNNYQELSFVL